MSPGEELAKSDLPIFMRLAHGGLTQWIERADQILARELQRELSRLEDMPWPSGRVLVSPNDGRTLERRLLPLVRAVRDERTPT